MNNSYEDELRRAVGLVGCNSIDYVEKLFELYSENIPVFLLKETPDNLIVKGVKLEKIIEPKITTGWFRCKYISSDSESIAQVAFTSGTEGEPKAIAISHLALCDTAKRLNKIMRVDSTIKEYVGAPVNFSFGLGRCRAVSLVGGDCYLPPAGFNLLEIRDMLQNGEINAVSAVPSLWRIVIESPGLFDDIGERLKWIEIGSQYMSRDEKESIRKIFPNANIIQHYGLTEASRTTFLNITEESGENLESVGRPSPNIQVSIGTDKKIRIRGPHVCTGIVEDAKIKSLIDQDGWFKTEDFGELKNGYLFYKGRADDIINCGGIKVSPDLLEHGVRKSLNDEAIEFCITKVSDNYRGEIPLVVVQSEFEQHIKTLTELLRSELVQLGVEIAENIPSISVDQLPRTKTGKVQRKALTAKYLESKPQDTVGINYTRPKSVFDIYKSIFHKEHVSADATFDTLGGDSINYVRTSVKLEKLLGQLPENWDKLTISELESLPAEGNTQTSIEVNVFLRAIAILTVVANHAGLSFIGGGTQLLFVLVGYNFARFQSEYFLSGKVWKSIINYSLKIVIPYLFLVLAYFLWKSEFSMDLILMYSNLTPPEGRGSVIFPAWFVQVLLQSLIVLGVVFSFKEIRKYFLKNLWGASFALLALLIFTRYVFPFIYDTHYLFQRVPPIYLASIWLGWVIYVSKTPWQKVCTAIAALALAVIHLGLDYYAIWIAAGGVSMLFINIIPMPMPIKRVTTAVASATFYIYLFHMIFIHFPAQVFKLDSPVINFVVGLGGSLMVWYLFELGLIQLAAQKIWRRLSTKN